MQELTFTTAQPYSFSFVPERTALVLVDEQRGFVDADIPNAVPVTLSVLAAARALGLHIVHARAGHSLVDELRPQSGEVVVDRPGTSVFWATGLHRRLMARGVTHLLIAGVATECSVTMTEREARDRGFQCCILTDVAGGFDASFEAASTNTSVSYGGQFGFAAPSAELVAYGEKASAAQEPPPPAASWDGTLLDLDTLQTQYRGAGLSPTDVVHAVFDRIEAYEKENPHAWMLLRSRPEVLADAQALVDKYTGVERDCLPPLYGIPFAVKDSFDVAGLETTAACPPFAYTATVTAPTVTACLEAGGLLIGKTNMDQLATGLSGCRSPCGIPSSVFRHANHKEDAYCPGGSSSGSAVVVGARLVTFALGTDTAGSGRVPAAFNGIVGFKPTKGTLSSRGVVACCRSLDTATILAPSVHETRRIWHVVDHYDAGDAFAKDPQSLPLVLADHRGVNAAGFTYATPPVSAMAAARLSPEYEAAFDKALTVVRAMGGRRHALDDAAYKPFVDATDLLYNGTLVNERIACIGEDFIRTNIARFHPVTGKLFQQVLDRNARPWDVYKDQLVQAEATRLANRLLSGGVGPLGGVGRGDDGHDGAGPGASTTVDVLVVPTAPFHPTVAAMQDDPIAMNAQLGVFTHFGNVLDLCAISVPAGTVDGGMPFGLCFVCARGLDGRLFDIATAFERALAASYGKRTS
ncbi:allophanate hydrolase [Sporothrix schenckii 1099-18]|uniref:Allophanate hydrolase n=1 Tax=Sporothrix schenckii 1099-18 TaxID=1397361 RepID=A0A0F2MF52_SPOSC|nr:allophanate hydrolase [Sporothrix schenckii 1099-18]KJR88267.1 allophanate hydrolase [Sporothrix schenckii 1099-18]